MKQLLALSLLLVATASHAEEFLGIEADVASQPAAESVGTVAVENDSSGQDYQLSNRWRFALSGGSSAKGRLGVNASVEYGQNNFLAWRLVGEYERYEAGSLLGEDQKGGLYYVLHLPNPTILKPQAGAGPGYVRWKRRDGEALFSDGGSVTANTFWGAVLLFTKHFGLSLQRHWVSYLGDTPHLYEDQKVLAEKTSISTSFGFYAYF